MRSILEEEPSVSKSLKMLEERWEELQHQLEEMEKESLNLS